MKNSEKLKRKISICDAKLAVIGLGYVGLPVAALFADKGFDVIGIDIKEAVVEKINRGITTIEGDEPGLQDLISKTVKEGRLKATTNYRQLKDRDIILIAVETPTNEENIPEYAALKSALASLGEMLVDGMLVVVESTIAPGTMADLAKPVLEDVSGLKVNQDFFLGHCPERVMPGKLLSNLTNLSRVVGGSNKECAQIMLSLYQHITDGDLDTADWITAELVKTVENAYRDVQIAFANEVAKICEALGANVWELRDLVNKSPNRQMHLPGAGVGGHCIPKDPWLLVFGTRDTNVPVKLISAARAVNDSMPYHIKDIIFQALREEKVDFKDAKVLIMGYSYLENSDDVRNSPSIVLHSELEKLGAEVVIHDPYVHGYKHNLYDIASNCNLAVVMVAHQDYQNIDFKKLNQVMACPLIVDGRNALSTQKVIESGFKICTIGVASNKNN
ncbi:nucleotide sugar dehydrogenase [Chloroflexota bacterium]